MRKGVFSLLFACLSMSFPSTGLGQSQTYSLSDLLSIAEENSDQIKIIEEEYEAGLQQVRFYRSEAFPQVAFTAASGIGSQSLTESSLGQGGEQTPGPPAAPEQPTIDFPQRVTGYSYNWGLSLRQPLVTFGRISNALRLAGMQDSVLEGSKRMQQDYLYLSVMQAFSDAYLADKQVIIARKSLASAQRLLERMNVEVKNGAGSQLDFLRVQSQAEAARADELMAISSREMAYRRLSQNVGLEIDTGYSITYSPEDSQLHIPRVAAANTEYVLKGIQADMKETQGDYERSKLLPSLYLSGTIENAVTISKSDDDMVDGFLSRYNQEFGDIADYRYFNYMIGLQLQWNIFDGFRTPAGQRQALAEAQKARYEQKQVGKKNEIAIRESRDRLEVLKQSMEAVESQLAAARRAFELVEEDYTRGFVDISDYLETEKDLRQAEKRLYELQMQRLLTIGQLRMNLGVAVYEGKP
ncbi:MAG: TolC family protein [Chitinivibrionales bacterium]